MPRAAWKQSARAFASARGQSGAAKVPSLYRRTVCRARPHAILVLATSSRSVPTARATELRGLGDHEARQNCVDGDAELVDRRVEVLSGTGVGLPEQCGARALAQIALTDTDGQREG